MKLRNKKQSAYELVGKDDNSSSDNINLFLKTAPERAYFIIV